MITTGANSNINSATGSRISRRASFWMVSDIARSIEVIGRSVHLIAQRAAGQRDKRVGEIGAMQAEVNHVDVQCAQALNSFADLTEAGHLEDEFSFAIGFGDPHLRQITRPSGGQRSANSKLHASAAAAE